MKSGGCSKARMIYAALAAVGSAAISAPINGPERSTTTEMTTTMIAVSAILSARSSRKMRRGEFIGVAFSRALSWPAQAGHPVIAAAVVELKRLDYWIVRFRGR